jgi:hypothetical protein
MADVKQDLTARGHRHTAIDIDGLGAPILGAVDDKAEFRLHRTAGEDAHDAGYSGVIMTGRLEQGCNRALANRAVYHDPKGALLVVAHHQDDGVGKTRIADRRCCDQQCPASEVVSECSGGATPSTTNAATSDAIATKLRRSKMRANMRNSTSPVGGPKRASQKCRFPAA